MNLHATCLPHHPSSVIYSSYHTLLGKLGNCSRFIIKHVLAMAIPPMLNIRIRFTNYDIITYLIFQTWLFVQEILLV